MHSVRPWGAGYHRGVFAMRRYLALLLCALSMQVGAVTYYIDCTGGSDANNGLSTGAPKLTVGSITLGANDSLNIKGGSVCAEQISITSLSGVTIAAYGAGKWIIDGGNARSYGILATSTDNTTISDGEIYGATENAISWNNDTAATTKTTFTVNRVTAHDIGPGLATPSGEAQFNDGTCFFARSGPSTGTAVLTRLTYNNTIAYNCGKHGYDTRWRVESVLHNRAVAYRSGLSATGHGFSSHPLFANTGGWALVSGNIYTRDRSSAADQERRIVNSTDSTVLLQNTSTPLTPGTNEWGVIAAGGGGACTNNVSLGCLTVNIGGAITGKTFIVKRMPHGPFTYLECTAYDNVDSQLANEGHGFSADDLSGPARYFSSLAYGNAGHGFTTLRGENIQWVGNVAFDNGGSGIHFNNCTNCEVTNNSVSANTTRGIWDAGITSINVDITNTIAISDRTRGMSVVAGTSGAAGFSSSNNYSFNNSTNACSNVTCVEADTKLTGGPYPTTAADFRLEAASPLIRAGVYVGPYSDYRGCPFWNPPSIGAYEICAGDVSNAGGVSP